MNDYEAKKQARIERYRERDEKAGQRSTEEFKTFDRMMDAIPLGQPILVGHHSEQRDRNYRDRAGRNIEKSIAESEKAAYYEQKARAAENNTAISSDDPDALEKLKAKLEKLEKDQMWMKRINAYYRKHKTCAGFEALTEAEAQKIDASMRDAYAFQTAPFLPYMLKNNSANIRRCRERIAGLQATREDPPEGWEFSGGRVEMDTEINRVQILFEEIPPKEFRQYMHREMRFNWSPSNEAWQRQLNRNGVAAARRVTEKYESDYGKEET